MFKLFVLSALCGVSLAAVHGNYNQHHSFAPSSHHHGAAASSDDAHAEVRVLQSDVRPDGFDYALETTNGIVAHQAGDVNGNVHGDYEFISPEGVNVRVNYLADENGYQPQSDVLPTPHPVPEAILKSLEYIRTHPPKEEPHYNQAPHQHVAHVAQSHHHHPNAFARRH